MMMRSLFCVLLAGGMAALTVSAEAGERAWRGDGAGAHAKSTYYRGGPKVRGYVSRRGGYSYSRSDTVNTYGNARSSYGSVNSYRDPFIDRQTRNGPFDHGFFFDSAIAPRGGDAPYMN